MVCRQKPNVLDRAVAFQLAENGLPLAAVGDFEALHCQPSTNFDRSTKLDLITEPPLLGRCCYAQHFIFSSRLIIFQCLLKCLTGINYSHSLMSKHCQKSSQVVRAKNSHLVTKFHQFLSVHFCQLLQNSMLLRQVPLNHLLASLSVLLIV